MAFDREKVGMFPSTTGTGGLLTYTTNDDGLGDVKADAFWNRDLTGAADRDQLHARKAVEDFVRKQRPASGRGVTMIVNANDGQEVIEVNVGGDGRIKPNRTAGWIVT